MNAPAVAHVGLAVPDLDGAVAWYRDALGLDVLLPPRHVSAEDGHDGRVAADVFGDALRSFQVAHLTGANGVALELFEFAEPAPVAAGFSHLCVTARDLDAAVERVTAAGGRLRTSRAWDLFEGEPYRMCYCEDRFGNVIELYSHSHERTWANRG